MRRVEIEEMTKRIKTILEKGINKQERQEKRGCWDEECKSSKEEVRRKLRKKERNIRKEGTNIRKYIKGKERKKILNGRGRYR